MKELKQKFILLLTLFVVVVGVGLWLILTNFFPHYAFQGYPLIPLFFFATGIVSIHTLTNLKLNRPNKLLNTFMLIRGVKMFFALVLTTTYWIVNKADTKHFAIMVVVFYILYLFLETYIYIKLEKWDNKSISKKIN